MSRSARKRVDAARLERDQHLSGWKRRKVEQSFNRPAVDMSRCIQAEATRPKTVAQDLKWDADDLEQLQLSESTAAALRQMGLTCRKLARLQALGQLDQLLGIDHSEVANALDQWL